MKSADSEATVIADGRCYFSYGSTPQFSGSSQNVGGQSRVKRGKIPGWFKFLFAVIVAGLAIGIYGTFYEKAPDVVEDQLAKLRENRITQAYYDYTAKEFQLTTSLDAFREFINLYPVLSKNKSFIVEDTSTVDHSGTVKGILISQELHEMEAVYHLVKEYNAWKIVSIRLKEAPHQNPADAASLALINKIEQQLLALRNNDINEAYFGFVSQDFLKETPLDAFKQFVKTHSVLSHFKGIEFKNHTIINDQGFVDLILDSDQGEYLLEYKLVRENGDWKVWSLRVTLSPEVAEKMAATNPKEMEHPIKIFLDDLLGGKIQHAYESTAKEFQESSSLESFKDFVGHYPVFQNRDLADIKGGLIENGIGQMKVNLHNESGMTVVQFKMGFESGEWKIWGVQIKDQPSESTIDASKPKSDKVAGGCICKTAPGSRSEAFR